MSWSNFKEEVKPQIDTIYNKGLDTETIIFKNGRGISKYELNEKKKTILESFKK